MLKKLLINLLIGETAKGENIINKTPTFKVTVPEGHNPTLENVNRWFNDIKRTVERG